MLTVVSIFLWFVSLQLAVADALFVVVMRTGTSVDWEGVRVLVRLILRTWTDVPFGRDVKTVETNSGRIKSVKSRLNHFKKKKKNTLIFTIQLTTLIVNVSFYGARNI